MGSRTLASCVVTIVMATGLATGEVPQVTSGSPAAPHSKEFWRALVTQDYAVPEGETASALLPEAERMLGSADSETREELGYGPISVWVYRDARLTPEELRALTARLRANLKAGLGETDNDTVFLRSFSALTLVVMVAQDARASFLTPEELGAVLEDTVAYAAAERDLRGYVPGKGWAHAAAHTADLLKLLARHPRIDSRGLERVLVAIASLTRNTSAVTFTHGEDERLARAALAVLRRDLVATDVVKGWAERLVATDGQCWERYRATATLDQSLYAASRNARGLLLNLAFFQELEEKPSASFSAARAAVRDALASLERH